MLLMSLRAVGNRESGEGWTWVGFCEGDCLCRVVVAASAIIVLDEDG